MKFIFTSRHFKAHDSLKTFAQSEIEKASKFYDGIIKSEVILSYEKAMNSVKIAEVIITTNTHSVITARERSEDFKVSIEGAVTKAASQLKKLKEKIKSNHSVKPISLNYEQE
jgi:ribosomal subunit interface protein